MNPIDVALQTSPILSRRQHPRLIGSIDRAVSTGRLIPLFPGTYAPVRTFGTLVAALFDWDPDAILTGASAARMSWWPSLSDDVVRAITRRRPIRIIPGTRLSHTVLDPDLVYELDGIRVQHPAASTLDLTREVGADAIDEALRRRATSVGALFWALELMKGRAGNPTLERLVIQSRNSPWSALERRAHAELTRARITGWQANYRIRTRMGWVFADIAFPGAMLIAEADGFEFHGSREAFVQDRQRDIQLKLLGWTVLRFTADTLDTLVPTLRSFLAASARRARRIA